MPVFIQFIRSGLIRGLIRGLNRYKSLQILPVLNGALAVLVFLAVLPVGGSQQVIAQMAGVCNQMLTQWNFDNASSATQPPTSFGTGNAMAGPGLGFLQIVTETGTNLAWSAGSFATTISLSVAANDYFTFSTGTVGQTGVQLRFDGQRTPTGPQTLTVYYSADGLAFAAGPTFAVSTTYQTFTADLSNVAALNNQTQISFRIYGYAAGSSAGRMRLDNVTVIGSIPCPTLTPSQMPLLTATATETATVTPIPTVTDAKMARITSAVS